MPEGGLPVIAEERCKYRPFALERPYRFAGRIPTSCDEVLVRTSSLWHRGMANRSPKPRPMLALTFGDKHEKELSDPFTQNERKVGLNENWYRPTRLGHKGYGAP